MHDVKKKLGVLRRRHDYLLRRAETYTEGKAADRDKAEASALELALAVIEAHPEVAVDVQAALRLAKRGSVDA